MSFAWADRRRDRPAAGRTTSSRAARAFGPRIRAPCFQHWVSPLVLAMRRDPETAPRPRQRDAPCRSIGHQHSGFNSCVYRLFIPSSDRFQFWNCPASTGRCGCNAWSPEILGTEQRRHRIGPGDAGALCENLRKRPGPLSRGHSRPSRGRRRGPGISDILSHSSDVGHRRSSYASVGTLSTLD